MDKKGKQIFKIYVEVVCVCVCLHEYSERGDVRLGCRGRSAPQKSLHRAHRAFNHDSEMKNES